PRSPPPRRRLLHRQRRHLDRLLRVCPCGQPVTTHLIEAREISKRYGPKLALHPVSFELERGACMVVTGPNGAGKTTLLRLLAGLAAPSRGVLDVRLQRHELGLVAHDPLVYLDLTGLENLDLFGRLYRVPERRERIGMLLERFGLWDARGQRVSTYSRGMTQRLPPFRGPPHQAHLPRPHQPFHGPLHHRSP